MKYQSRPIATTCIFKALSCLDLVLLREPGYLDFAELGLSLREVLWYLARMDSKLFYLFTSFFLWFAIEKSFVIGSLFPHGGGSSYDELGFPRTGTRTRSAKLREELRLGLEDYSPPIYLSYSSKALLQIILEDDHGHSYFATLINERVPQITPSQYDPNLDRIIDGALRQYLIMDSPNAKKIIEEIIVAHPILCMIEEKFRFDFYESNKRLFNSLIDGQAFNVFREEFFAIFEQDKSQDLAMFRVEIPRLLEKFEYSFPQYCLIAALCGFLKKVEPGVIFEFVQNNIDIYFKQTITANPEEYIFEFARQLYESQQEIQTIQLVRAALSEMLPQNSTAITHGFKHAIKEISVQPIFSRDSEEAVIFDFEDA